MFQRKIKLKKVNCTILNHQKKKDKKGCGSDFCG